ncbi:MAG: DEAD/DEAH box helicase family protein, partial [Acidimicrobiia bacterium]
MKIELKDFQQEAVDDLAAKVRYATEGAVKVGLQAVVLSAPTGSGKTIIATALIERILNGDDEAEADPDATFLWVTDLPELN